MMPDCRPKFFSGPAGGTAAMEERFSPLLAGVESGGVVAKVGMGESDDKERKISCQRRCGSRLFWNRRDSSP